MTLFFLFLVFVAFTGIFVVFGFNLFRGAIGLINRRYWIAIPEEKRWSYCRRMGLGTILVGLGFLVGAAAILLSIGRPENTRALWAFIGIAVGCLPGVLLILITLEKFSPGSIRKKKKK